MIEQRHVARASAIALAALLLAILRGSSAIASPIEPEGDSSSQSAFAVGERLVFDVGFGFITAGEAIMSIPKSETIAGYPCYQVSFQVNSTPTFSWFYEVRDRYETFLDVEGIFPWRFEQHVKEGKYHLDFAAQFDQVKHVANASGKEFPIPPKVQDIMSAFYYVRTLDFSHMPIGERIHLHNFIKDTTYDLDVKFIGRQTIEVDAGTFKCLIIEPLAREGGLFKSDGRVLLWLSDDDRKIPVKVSTKIIIGSINSELREYSGINGELKARIK